MGAPEFAVPTLREIVKSGRRVVAVYTRAPKPGGRRGLEIRKTPVHEAAEALGIPVYTPATLKTETAQEAFRSHAADVGLVIGDCEGGDGHGGGWIAGSGGRGDGVLQFSFWRDGVAPSSWLGLSRPSVPTRCSDRWRDKAGHDEKASPPGHNQNCWIAYAARDRASGGMVARPSPWRSQARHPRRPGPRPGKR